MFIFTFYDYFEFNSKLRPDKLAIVYKENRLTFKELSKKVNRIAYSLAEVGLKKGDRIGLLHRNSDMFVALFLAIQKLGAVAVLLNWRHTFKEVYQLVELTECVCLVYDESSSDIVDEIKSSEPAKKIMFIRSGNTRILGEMNIEDLCAQGKEVWDYVANVEPTDEAMCFFTSGTSSLSKAVMHTQNNLSMWVSSQLINSWIMTDKDVFLCAAPLFHLGGMQYLLFAMSCGACLIIEDKCRAGVLLQLIEREKITMLTLIPPGLCLDLLDYPDRNKFNLDSVKLVFLLGGANLEIYIKAIYKIFPNASFVHAWGMSELTGVTNMVMSRGDFERFPHHRTSIGRIARGSRLKLLDEEGNEVPMGQPGIAYGKTPFMMTGYLNSTSQFSNDGYFNTRDILRQEEDGFYYFVGRVENILKSGGENVSALEVENVIKTMPGVNDCVVFGMPHKRLGEIIAAAVVNKKNDLTEDDVKAYCDGRMAGFKKPRKVFIVDKLPLNTTGKVIRYKIQDFVFEHCNNL